MRAPQTVLLAGAAVIILVMLTVATDESFLTPGTLIIATLGVGVSALAVKRPLFSAFVYCGLVLFTVWHPEWRSFLNLAWGAVIMGLIAYRRPWYVALLPTGLMFFVSSIDLNTWPLVPVDIFSSMLFVFLYGTGITVGTISKRVSKRHSAEKAAYRNRIREERNALMSTLHDSVSASLTSVVMRSEALALQHSANPKAADTAVAIADDARKAMGEVRDLIRIMRMEAPNAVKYKALTLGDELIGLGAFLRSHDFICEPSGRLPKSVARRYLPHDLHLVFTEIGSNLIKYSQIESEITLQASYDKNSVRVTISSLIARTQTGSHLTTGLGLKEMENRIVSIGGSFFSGPEEGRWVTRISLPASALIDL